jgi:6-phosphofructokinase 1
MKRIALITSGGDAPGMNAAIRAVVREAIYLGLEVYGICRGYKGLLEGEIGAIDRSFVSGIINKGGTVLRTGRCPETRTAEGMAKVVKMLKRHEVEGLIIIGGDGSLAAGSKITKAGIPVVCIPGSIDNDIFGTDETIGFDTALDTAVEAIDKIRDTADSHERVFVVEVMGREHGFLALSIGMAVGAEFVIVPEVKYDVKKIAKNLAMARQRGKRSLIIVFAEGAGNAHEFTKQIEKFSGLETRLSSLGYIQRGGAPSGRSRILAGQFGAHAVRVLLSGIKGCLVVKRHGKISELSMAEAMRGEKKLDGNMLALAHRLSK